MKSRNYAKEKQEKISSEKEKEVKHLGCCTSCSKEVYEITRRYPLDHPYAKEPLQTGKSINAVIKTLLMTDGSSMDLTYCPDCKVNFSKDYRTVLDAWAREMTDEYRINVGMAVIENKEKYIDWFAKMLVNLPLAVLGEKRA